MGKHAKLSISGYHTPGKRDADLETKECKKCRRFLPMRYYKQTRSGLCTKCNFCRLRQNSYIERERHSEKGRERARKRREKREAQSPKGPLNVPHKVKHRPSEHVLLCTSCNRNIGHIVYRKYQEQDDT